MMSTVDIANLRQWIGKVEVRLDLLSPSHAPDGGHIRIADIGKRDRCAVACTLALDPSRIPCNTVTNTNSPLWPCLCSDLARRSCAAVCSSGAAVKQRCRDRTRWFPWMMGMELGDPLVRTCERMFTFSRKRRTYWKRRRYVECDASGKKQREDDLLERLLVIPLCDPRTKPRR